LVARCGKHAFKYFCNYWNQCFGVVFRQRSDSEHIVLLDASKLGETVTEGKNQRTVLTPIEEQLIIDTLNNKKAG
jgi:hypothetical protein